MERLTNLSVTTETLMQADHVYETLTLVGRGLMREGYSSVSISTQKLEKDPWDEESTDEIPKDVLSFKVHVILCRLGMTETEAHNAIAQINNAGITFVKEGA
jgi:hypothetical protein